MKSGLQRGLLNVLSEDDVQRIHEASLELLEEPGIVSHSRLIAQTFSDAGAPVDTDFGMIRIPRELVQAALDSAPSSFVFCGRDPQMDMLLEQGRVYFGMGGTAVPFFWDSEEQTPREPSKADMVTATRVGHVLPHVDFMMSLAAASDVRLTLGAQRVQRGNGRVRCPGGPNPLIPRPYDGCHLSRYSRR